MDELCKTTSATVPASCGENWTVPAAWRQHDRQVWMTRSRLSSLNKDVCLQSAVAFTGENRFAWHQIKPFDLSRLPSGVLIAHQQLGHWLCNHHSACSALLLPSQCTISPTVVFQYNCPKDPNYTVSMEWSYNYNYKLTFFKQRFVQSLMHEWQ